MYVLKSMPAGSPPRASDDSPVPSTSRNSTGCTSELNARSRSLRNLISSRRQTMLIARRSCLSPLSGTETRIAAVIGSLSRSVTPIAICYLLPPMRLLPPAERHHVGAVPVADRRLSVPDRPARVGHEDVVQRGAGHAHRADGLRELSEQVRHELLPGFHVKRHQAIVYRRVQPEAVLEFPDARLAVGRGRLPPVLADAGPAG